MIILNVVPVEKHETQYPACFMSKKTAVVYLVQGVYNTFQKTKHVWNI